MAVERTLVLVKPNGVARGLMGEVIARFERRGFVLTGARLLVVEPRPRRGVTTASTWASPSSRIWSSFITSGPVMAMVVQGPSAVKVVRDMMGATNPIEAAPGTIRGDFALEIGENVVHGSDSVESAEREIGLFFAAGPAGRLGEPASAPGCPHSPADFRLYLASASPRRRELLVGAGRPVHRRRGASAEEVLSRGRRRRRSPSANARAKARGAVLPADAPAGCFVLGADTIVVVDGSVLGKPADARGCSRHARRPVGPRARGDHRRRAGAPRRVAGGVWLGSTCERGGCEQERACRRRGIGDHRGRVPDPRAPPTSTPTSPRASGRAKRAAYAIQGLAAFFVQGIVGDYANVVGLPLSLVAELFRRQGFDLLRRAWLCRGGAHEV